ncbi:hypothetical protein [Flagellimonas lutaonensis]|uniref:Uncharacterized protein n=1 Tax=Flagellimonas lutaonensis TaxID=516051 RepID=A0A0D5YR01_9FLAO|nr:hypothetical protein [Allomuricauda lutaonensis]AKA34276.1 hypothetical protein VC82_604 [Allomuricauda lutaonensis]
MKRKWYKIVVWILIGIVALFFILAVWYKYEYSMDPVEPYTIYAESFEDKLLIATQGSEFKNAVVQRIVDHYENDSLFIKVIDVSGLPQIAPSDYSAILILHTWEYDKPPEAVEEFITENKDDADKFVVFSTSGEGGNTVEGVDGLAGESVMADVPVYSGQIIKKLDGLLDQ